MTLERDVDRALTRAVKAAGGESIKLTTLGRYGVSGYPDRLVLLPGGRAGFVELKRPGGQLSKRQQLALDRLERLGYVTAMLDNPGGATTIVKMIARGSRP